MEEEQNILLTLQRMDALVPAIGFHFSFALKKFRARADAALRIPSNLSMGAALVHFKSLLILWTLGIRLFHGGVSRLTVGRFKSQLGLFSKHSK